MVGITTLFRGQYLWWEWWIRAFKALEFDRAQLCVFWLDDSGDPESGQLPASYVVDHRQEYRRFGLHPGPQSGTTRNERMAASYNELGNVVLKSGESFSYPLAYENDAVMPPNGLHQLHLFLAENHMVSVAAGAALEYSRRSKRASVMAWRVGEDAGNEWLARTVCQVPASYPGAEEVDAVGMGFALLRSPAFLRTALCPSALGLNSAQPLGWEIWQLGGRTRRTMGRPRRSASAISQVRICRWRVGLSAALSLANPASA